MKITVTGSLGNISKPLAQKLLALGHDITIISSQADRKAEIEALGAKAAVGSVTNAEFLESAFAGADAVYVMIPPNLGGSHFIENAARAGEAYASAITAASVKRVVMLSSIGADKPDGNGPIAGLYKIEEQLSRLEGVDLVILRAGYFYFNLFGNISLIKGMGIMGSNTSANNSVPLVHPSDIADAAAEELLGSSTGKNIRYVVSDWRKWSEVAAVLGSSIGKPDFPWVQFTDEQAKQGMIQAGLGDELASLYVEMGNGLRDDHISEDFIKRGRPVTGKTKLETFAEDFSKNF